MGSSYKGGLLREDLKTNSVYLKLKNLFYLKPFFVFTTLSNIFTYLFITTTTVNAAQGDKIITAITSLAQDVYSDFVYLSLGFATVVCIYHLICIIFVSGDERSRSHHTKAIVTTIIAWALINVFTLVILKIFNLTGSNTPSDIFDSSGYGN